ncbi:acetylcholinesterase-like [Liolophura sinensis]|uniref:acetylcholinesterase-like n=1 Tax=Liolophura sinensis TaxID=3198878 RepID=UPI003158AAEA
MAALTCLAMPLLCCAAMSTVFMLCSGQGIQSPVNTTSGMVTGKTLVYKSKRLLEFKMVPYAEPPIGNLRFKPAQLKTREAVKIDGTQSDYTVCPQSTIHLTQLERVAWNLVSDNRTVSEDCLYLDIYVPESASPKNLLPVMFWIHGGGYTAGAGRLSSGHVLAADYEVILVTTNYRLGALGFLNTADDTVVMDIGLRDQVLALQWVNNNIAHFGGDPDMITIAGESAGSASVAQLMTSPLTEGLFKRAILESSGLKAPWSCLSDPKAPTMALAAKVNCTTQTSQEMVECLKSKRWEELLMYQGTTWAPACSGGVIPYTQEELDTSQLSSDVAKRLAKVDILIGVNSQEGSILFELFSINNTDDQGGVSQKLADSMITVLLQMSGLNYDYIEKLLPSVRFLYTDWTMPGNTLARSRQVNDLFGDYYFITSVIKYIHLHARVQVPAEEKGQAYLYLLQHRPSWMTQAPWQYGAAHGDDLFLVFGNPIEYPSLNATAQEVVLSQTIMTYWTNFVKTGNPNTPETRVNATSLVQWPQFELDNQTYLQLDIPTSDVSADHRLFPRRMAFWTEYFPSELERLKSVMAPAPSCEKEPSRSSITHATLFTMVISFVVVASLQGR